MRRIQAGKINGGLTCVILYCIKDAASQARCMIRVRLGRVKGEDSSCL